jgi:hypothetical protein
LAQGHQAFFYEPPEGGHAGATDNAQSAFNAALAYAFLRKTIAPEMTEEDRIAASRRDADLA